MDVAEDEVLLRVDHFGFVVGLLAPEQEDDAAGLLVDGANHVVRKLLPPLLLMTVALALLNSQNRVKQEDALFGPFS